MTARKLREGGQWAIGVDGKTYTHFPDEKISSEEIARRQATAKKLELFDFREDVAMLAPQEVNDLRASMRRVQATGDSASSLRAMRMLQVLEWYEDAQRERQALGQVIDDAGSLSDAFQELRDNFADELKRDRTDAITELFTDNPTGTHEQLIAVVGDFVEAAFQEAEKDIRAKVEAMQKPVELHLRALEALKHDEA